jgi:hypothetical protein
MNQGQWVEAPQRKPAKARTVFALFYVDDGVGDLVGLNRTLRGSQRYAANRYHGIKSWERDTSGVWRADLNGTCLKIKKWEVGA